MAYFCDVTVNKVDKGASITPKFNHPVELALAYDQQGLRLNFKQGSSCLLELTVSPTTECAKVGTRGYIITIDDVSQLINFRNEEDRFKFHDAIARVKFQKLTSVFTERTEDSSALQYFQFYSYLSQQQNMMQDFVRTATYQRAIHTNICDFEGKVVLDVGAGSGILSFFAVQSGARRVYAVEASNMAQHAQSLIAANNLSDKIIVIPGKIEEITLPEMCDVIISEPMGYMLYNERMLESYLHAKKWLKPKGIMFPSRGDLHIAPFNDEGLFMEQANKANFWHQQSFHGVDLSSLQEVAMKEYFRQPVVDTFDIRICMAKSERHIVDFQTASEEDLHEIDVPLEFVMLKTGEVHGLAFWFDVSFIGSRRTIWLSTAPTEPLTHWYQVRCLLEQPLFVQEGQRLTGSVLLLANQRQSYDVTIDLTVEGTSMRSKNTLDLKNPYFRYTGQAPPAPPGEADASPSETFWQKLDTQGGRQGNVVDGIQMNGIGELPMEAAMTFHNVVGNASPNIHPGSISSTGRQRVVQGTATSTQQAQLIGGGISPTLFTSPQTHQIVLGNTSHYPVNNSLMIGDYVTPGSHVLTAHNNYRQ